VTGARGLLDGARRIVVLTGAGISAESGVPTFRGAGGLWKEFRAEDLATPEAFARDPRLVWEWYGWRRALVGKCEPNPAHLALARFALARANVLIVTQNVDGLHARAASMAAGADDPGSALPLEIHGSLFRVKCTVCSWSVAHDAEIDASGVACLPRCERCGALARPAVVWFGEALDPVVLQRAFDESAAADVCLVIGTSALVHPAASLPSVTRDSGGAVIEVNPDETPLTRYATVSIRGTAVEVIPGILPP
jgi:NAD-dependent deacetylase